MENLLLVTSEVKTQIQKYYKVTKAEVKEDVEIIKEWMTKQPHLPQNLTDDLLEKILVRNKFRVERTKQKLDNYYTMRGHNKDLIRDFENVIPSKHVTTFLPMPKLTPNFERIVIMHFLNPDPEDYDIIEVIKIDFAVEELCLQYDYAIGVRYLFDFAGCSLKHLTKVNPILLAKHVSLLEKAYSQRMLGIELVNFPSFAHKILALLKLVLRPKIYERVRIHEKMETVYKLMPKEYLPAEYGGTLSNIPDLLKKWDTVMKEHRDFFVKNYERVSLEHLRPLESKADEIFGVDGYEWVPCHHFNIPHNAVKCGNDLDGSDIYIGSTFYQGDELPCKIIPRRREAYVSYAEREIKVSNFKVLCQKTMCWLPSSNGHVPAGAIPGGRTELGETLYIGRSKIGNATVVGKVHPSHGCLYVPYDGKEIGHKQYEVLVFH